MAAPELPDGDVRDLKIAVVCDVLGRENNGTTVAAMNLIRTLNAKGHDVRVVCADADKSGQAGYHIVPKYDLGIFNGYVERNGVVIAKADERVLASAIDGADVVHVLLPFSLAPKAVKLCRARGIPVTASFHCQAENVTSHIFLKDFTPANRLVYHVFYRRLYRYCTAIHYPTQFICDVFEREVGPTNHYIVSNGVNAMFRPKTVSKPPEWADRFVLLFSGRFSKEKSHRVLIDAVRRSKYADRIQLVFAGTGPLETKLRAYAAKRLPIQPVFRFFPREELVDVINMADLYVHPAEVEIEAISCLEAISCGKTPLIADSPRSATRWFALTPDNLFKNRDAKDLAAKIDFWLSNPAERQRCSALYLGYAEQFDYLRCMDRMEAMLKEAAKNRA